MGEIKILFYLILKQSLSKTSNNSKIYYYFSNFMQEVKTLICRFLRKIFIFLPKVFFRGKKLLYFILLISEKRYTKLTKKIKRKPRKNFENLEKSWNFVGQRQWEPWCVCVCVCVCVFVYMYVYVFMYVCTCVYVRVCVCILMWTVGVLAGGGAKLFICCWISFLIR